MKTMKTARYSHKLCDKMNFNYHENNSGKDKRAGKIGIYINNMCID